MTLKCVADLYVNCSFPIVWGAGGSLAASDTCQKPADTAVVDDDGNRWWRCPEHLGWLNSDLDGPVLEEVEVRD